MKKYLGILTLILSLVSVQAFAEENAAPAASSSALNVPLYELGVTFGTPGLVNAVLGYWSADPFPWLVRVSGMDYGPYHEGVQADIGWAFSKEGSFKQYLALSFATIQWNDTTSNTTLNFTGVGPTYGFNFRGLAVEASLGFGSGNRRYQDGTMNDSSVQFMGNVGYTFLF